MKKSTLFSGLLLISTIILVSSCKKDDDDNTRYLTKVYDSGSLNEEYQWQGNQLQKTNNYNSAGAIRSYQEFAYSDGKLVQLDNYNSTQKKTGITNNIGYRNLINYNNNLFHRITRLKGSGDPDVNFTVYSYYRYKYLDGKVNKITYYTKTSTDLYVTNSYDTIEYNGSQISKYKYYWENKIVYYVTYTWINDNVTSESYSSNQNGNFVLTQKYDYQYDDKINKYKSIMNLPLLEPEILSKNNQISASSTSYYDEHEYTSAISIAYQYNSDNYPTQQTETDVDSQNELKVYSFEYR